MPPPQNLEDFLRTAFDTKQLLRWVATLNEDQLMAELPGDNSPLAEVAHAIVQELHRRQIPEDTIFTSLLQQRPRRAYTLAAIRQSWTAIPRTAKAPKLRSRALLTASGALVIFVVFTAWNLLTPVPAQPSDLRTVVTPPSPPFDPLPEPQPAPMSSVSPEDKTPAPAMDAPPTDESSESPALRMTLQNCYKPTCNDAPLGGMPRFCSEATYTVQLAAAQPSHVTFVNFFDGQWSLAETKLDLQLDSSRPKDAQIYVYLSKAERSVARELLVALAFPSAAARRAYRSRFGKKQPGTALPTPKALGMHDISWEEARFEYEIDPSCP